MIKREVQSALDHNIKQRIHLISGETFTGICEINQSMDSLNVSTKEGTFSVPFWTIKRFVRT